MSPGLFAALGLVLADAAAWSTSTPLLAKTANLCVTVTPGNVFVAGGKGASSAPTAAVSFAPLGLHGAIGAWGTAALPVPARGVGCEAARGFLYAVGGDTAAGAGHAPSAALAHARINVDDTLGVWSTQSLLPAAVSAPCTAVFNGALYVVGGLGQTQPVASAGAFPFAAGGQLSAYVPGPDLPRGVGAAGCALDQGVLYVLGGTSTAGDEAQVYAADLGVSATGSLGPWRTLSPLPAARTFGSAAVASGKLYLVGGESGGVALDEVLVAAIDTLGMPGMPGQWSAGTKLPSARSRAAAFTSGSFLFLVGGADASSAAVETVLSLETTGPTPPPPDKLVFGLLQPGSLTGLASAPPIVIAVVLPSGAADAAATVPVTLSLQAHPGPAQLSGALTVLAQGGIATFTDARLSADEAKLTLVATSPGLVSAATPPFDFTSAPSHGCASGGADAAVSLFLCALVRRKKKECLGECSGR